MQLIKPTFGRAHDRDGYRVLANNAPYMHVIVTINGLWDQTAYEIINQAEAGDMHIV
jgi:hypothetical protein